MVFSFVALWALFILVEDAYLESYETNKDRGERNTFFPLYPFLNNQHIVKIQHIVENKEWMP